MVWGEHSLKMAAPELSQFVNNDVLKIWRKRMTDSMNQLLLVLLVPLVLLVLLVLLVKGVSRTAPAMPGQLRTRQGSPVNPRPF